MTGVMVQGTVQIALVAAPAALMLPLVVGENGSWYGWIVAIEAVGAFLGATIGAALKTALHTGIARDKLGRVFSVDAVATQGLRPVGYGYVAADLLLGLLGTPAGRMDGRDRAGHLRRGSASAAGLRHLGLPQRIDEPLPTGSP